MPARYIGRDSASDDEREMIVLSRSKKAASITRKGTGACRPISAGSMSRPATRLLERGASRAHLVGREVPRPGAEVVRASVVRLDDPKLERAAGAACRAGSAERDLSVVTDAYAPLVTDDVLVDLELDLDASVLRTELELPVAPAAARTLADHIAVPRGRNRRYG